MIRNYLKVALRNIRRHKAYSLINILGLSVGMACFFLIFLYVQHEFSYDRFHEKSDQIYRIKTEWSIEGQTQVHNTTAAPVAPALINDFPEVQNTVRLYRIRAIIRHKDQSFVESRVYMADPSFLEVFSFPLIRGNPKTVLSNRDSIVITKEMAEKYFGGEDPTGKILTFWNRFDFKISGIAENAPPNSHLEFDFLIRFDLINDFSNFNYLENWSAWNFQTYILLQKDFPVEEFEKKSTGFIKKYRGEDTSTRMFHLQSLTKINLETQDKIKYIYLFSAIGIIILLLACINFTNLSIAQSSTRVTEIGMRKVIGAQRHQLIKQFIGESMVLTFIALPLAFLFIRLILPWFNSLVMTQFHFNHFHNPYFIMSVIGIALSVSLISGSYPAFYQSTLQPVQSLKGEFKSGSRVSLLRSFLVIFQFATSIILITGAIVIYNQLNYIRNKDLGFNKDHVVNIPIYDSQLKQKYEYVKAELLKEPNILSASISSFSPGSHPHQSVDWEGRKEDEDFMMAWYSVDYDFIETFDIDILEGRNFSKAFSSDVESAYILNESAVKAFGWERPVGKQFQVERSGWSMGTVIGIMKDFHFDSLHQKIMPLALVLHPEGGYHFSLRISPYNVGRTLNFIKNKFMEFSPHTPFEYDFLDRDLDDMYRLEDRLGKLLNSFSFLAIFIACLGLLGLASFAIARRTKEIGIRKILGASVSNVIVLLAKDFTRLVVIANVIAWPIGYYAMSKWLQNFAYRSPLSIWIFIAAGIITLTIAILTISFQSIKAAVANPVDSLRYE
jgi:putative ABC transport system permease protein